MVMPMFPMSGMNLYGNAYQNVRARYSCGHVDSPNPHPVMARYPGEYVPDIRVNKLANTWFGRLLQKLYR